MREEWFPFRALPYGNAVVDGKPREDWDWTVLSNDDPNEGATSFDCESEKQAEWLASVLNAAHSYVRMAWSPLTIEERGQRWATLKACFEKEEF